MRFFSKEQKQLALSCDKKNLQELYEVTENNLKEASKIGSDKLLKKAMKEHGRVEYALLYQNTSEYKNKIKKRGQNEIK